ncbi:AAA family ATPase [Pseudomonas mucidolens]|uniref:AAA family ATPase n=1 Tax=Pseudomonas mucidolens TaxID=46679 RepID=UPI0030DC1516
MINSIEIKGYKSIDKLKFELGKINVFIGENGAGKSNLLEAIALAAAANANKLDNEFLMARGIRVTNAPLMRPRFDGYSDSDPIQIKIETDEKLSSTFIITNDNKPYSTWSCEVARDGNKKSLIIGEALEELAKDDVSKLEKLKNDIEKILENLSDAEFAKKHAATVPGNFKFGVEQGEILVEFLSGYGRAFAKELKNLSDFVIFSPENTFLRMIEKEGQIEPLGINGEGLIKLLLVLSELDNGDTIKEINECLKVLGWFDGFSIEASSGTSAATIDIHDKYLSLGKQKLDHRSANEGFMFLLFYFSLFSTNLTPSIFAIDNIDASLNPKLCTNLIEQLSKLTKKHDKQALLTTHNPAVLDGLNLEDPDQRLFVIYRNPHGCTRIKRVTKPKGVELKLSEMFMRGVIGGLPKGF